MEELLTTRQVQDLLKVDRITIYRMLQDGRLKGVKIGQQWRFPRREVERLLGRTAPAPEPEAVDLASGFPTHCVQTIQDLYAEVSGLSAVVIDENGNPLTEASRPCDFCRLLWGSESGKKACRESWKEIAGKAQGNSGVFTCHAGLQYLVSPILDEGKPVAWFLSGPCYWQAPLPEEESAYNQMLAARHNLPMDELRAARRAIRIIEPQARERVLTWPAAAARAVQSILRERISFIERLQQIANLTQIR